MAVKGVSKIVDRIGVKNTIHREDETIAADVKGRLSRGCLC